MRHPLSMEQSLAEKLRLTAAALGSGSRKELCQRFHEVNPRTICVLDRLHKWLQGRALPRSPQFYEDWARVIGSARPGPWFASCSVQAMLAELATLFDADPELLLRAETLGMRVGGAPGSSARRAAPSLQIAGHYACYSHAWSPHYHGRLIRGSLVLAASAAGGIAVGYTEAVAGRVLNYQGTGTLAGGAVMLHVCEPGSQSQLLLTLFAPRPPASVLCGMMSGVTVLDHEPRPSAGRLVAVRLPDGEDKGAARGYLPVAPRVVAEDLRACGFPVLPGNEIDRSVLAFLNGHNDPGIISQIRSEQHSDLVQVFDRMFLAGQDGVSPSDAPAAEPGVPERKLRRVAGA